MRISSGKKLWLTDRRRLVFAGAGLVCVLGMLGAGCTSDDPGLVGTGLVDDAIDRVLVELPLQNVDAYKGMKVEDPLAPLHEQQVLYLGEEAGTKSVMLANYDFSAIDSLERFTEENIKNVRFSLTTLTFYTSLVDTVDDSGDSTQVRVQPLDLYYVVNQLAEPFGEADFIDPGAIPSFNPLQLNSDYLEPNNSSEPRLKMFTRDFVAWVAAQEKIGLVVQFTSQSDQALVGYGSRDLTKVNELPPLGVGTVVAPNFAVEFQDNSFFLLAPYADTSTYHEVPEAPTSVDDGIIFRTGLRSYPALHFDYSALPPNSFINNAVLRLTNNPLTSFGPLATMVAVELDTTLFLNELKVETLETDSYFISARTSLDPTLETVIEFDVTQAVQRIVNNVYEGTRGVVLMAPESFQTGNVSFGVPADFYYRQFNFFGSAALPALRPVLRIAYSKVEDLDGGGK